MCVGGYTHRPTTYISIYITFLWNAEYNGSIVLIIRLDHFHVPMNGPNRTEPVLKQYETKQSNKIQQRTLLRSQVLRKPVFLTHREWQTKEEKSWPLSTLPPPLPSFYPLSHHLQPLTSYLSPHQLTSSNPFILLLTIQARIPWLLSNDFVLREVPFFLFVLFGRSPIMRIDLGIRMRNSSFHLTLD